MLQSLGHSTQQRGHIIKSSSLSGLKTMFCHKKNSISPRYKLWAVISAAEPRCPMHIQCQFVMSLVRMFSNDQKLDAGILPTCFFLVEDV